MGFLSDLFKDAFENDSNLSPDKGTGQLEGPGLPDPSASTRPELTEVQRRFLSSQASAAAAGTGGTSSSKTRGGSSDRGRGAPIDPSLLAGTSWDLNFYLAGVPERDPSNDLYGRRVNISNRDRTVGLGAEVPTEPNASVRVTLKDGGVCVASPSEFASGEIPGQWKVSDDGRCLRLSIVVRGYRRTVTTRGTIQKIYWSKEEEKTTKTSTSYVIPEGWVYCDVGVGYGLPGRLVMRDDGVVRVERSAGLLGAGSKMESCGKFGGTMVTEESSSAKEGKEESKRVGKGGML